MDSQRSDKKPRSFYVDYTKRHNKFGGPRRGGYGGRGGGNSNNARFREAPDVGFGNRGFLITSVDEVRSYLEMRNILEGYFEELYKPAEDHDAKQVSSETKEPTSVEDELEAELRQLRVQRPFKQVKTHCRNSIFINIAQEFSHVDPVAIVNKFFEDLAEKRQIRTSSTFKVLPILDTFRGNVSCLKESISNVIQGSFKGDGPKKYFIEFQTRGNYKLDTEDKQKMIEGLAEAIASCRPEWTVSREGADYIIAIIALKNVCCLSILEDYFKRCKYNVMEFCKDFVQSEKGQIDVAGDEDKLGHEEQIDTDKEETECSH